jgi:predicted ATPase
MASRLDAPPHDELERHVEQAESEIDNLRAAFAWSRENNDVATNRLSWSSAW